MHDWMVDWVCDSLAALFVAYVTDLSPIYMAKNFWHGSDEKSTCTKKIGSARIHLVM